MSTTKVLIAEDHKVVIMGTTQMLHDAMEDIRTTGAMDMQEVLEALNSEVFDLLILDINIPGGDRPAMIGEIRHVQPGIKILIFSGYDEALYAYPYLQAGADGYISKNAKEKEFQHAVLRVLDNEKYLSVAMQQQSINKLISTNPESTIGLKVLSAREIELLKLLIKGSSTAVIGKELGLKVSTVSTHKINIYKKLGVSNLVELVEYVKLH